MKKLLSVLLLGTLILGQAPPAQTELPETLDIANLAIPESLGKIDSRFTGTSERWVIHIQDVHAHLTAQQNISAILEHLNLQYGIRAVGMEGSWYDSSLPKSWALPASREKNLLAQTLLEEDYINGSVNAAMFAPNPIHLIGLEDPAAYHANGLLYIKFLERREEILQKVSISEKKLTAAKENVFNPDLLSFDQGLSAFRDGKKGEVFLPDLLRLAEAKKIQLEDLSQLKLFRQAVEVERSIDKAKLENEKSRLVQTFKYQNMSFEELLKNNKLPEEKLAFYPEASKYQQISKIQEQIHSRKLFEEFEIAIDRLKEKLLQTAEEKELFARAQAFGLAKRIILLQSSAQDLRNFHSQQTSLGSELKESVLEEDLQLGLDFYEAALKRDSVFFEKITADSRLSGNIALVTGGFHTEGLSEQLEKASVSYIVITPSLGTENEPVNEELYFKRIRANLSEQNAFSDVPPQVLTRDAAFVRAENRLKLNRNTAEALNVYLSFQEGTKAKKVKSALQKSAFTALPEEEQTVIVSRWLEELKTSQKPILIIVRQSVLEKLLKDPLALKLWREYILPNRLNKIVLVQSKTPKPFEEGGRNVKPIRGKLREIVAREKEKSLGPNKRLGVIDRKFRGDADTLVFPPKTAALLLLRPLLEQDERISLQDPAVIERIQAIMQALFQAQETAASA